MQRQNEENSTVEEDEEETEPDETKTDKSPIQLDPKVPNPHPTACRNNPNPHQSRTLPVSPRVHQSPTWVLKNAPFPTSPLKWSGNAKNALRDPNLAPIRALLTSTEPPNLVEADAKTLVLASRKEETRLLSTHRLRNRPILEAGEDESRAENEEVRKALLVAETWLWETLLVGSVGADWEARRMARRRTHVWFATLTFGESFLLGLLDIMPVGALVLMGVSILCNLRMMVLWSVRRLVDM